MALQTGVSCFPTFSIEEPKIQLSQSCFTASLDGADGRNAKIAHVFLILKSISVHIKLVTI